MNFKEFILLDELFGMYGNVGQANGVTNVSPIPKRGSSVKRSMSDGKVKSPSRPAIFTSFNKPTTISSKL